MCPAAVGGLGAPGVYGASTPELLEIWGGRWSVRASAPTAGQSSAGVRGMVERDKSHGPNLIGRPPSITGHLPHIDWQMAAWWLHKRTGHRVASTKRATGPPQNRGATELWYVSLLGWVCGWWNIRDGHLARVCACHASCQLVT